MYLYLITSFILQMPILNQELFSLEMNNPVMSDQRQSSGHGPFFFFYPVIIMELLFYLVVMLSYVVVWLLWPFMFS